MFYVTEIIFKKMSFSSVRTIWCQQKFRKNKKRWWSRSRRSPHSSTLLCFLSKARRISSDWTGVCSTMEPFTLKLRAGVSVLRGTDIKHSSRGESALLVFLRGSDDKLGRVRGIGDVFRERRREMKRRAAAKSIYFTWNMQKSQRPCFIRERRENA